MADSTLLLADDSVTIQKVVNLTFSGEGIDVVTVGDGNSAMDVLRESPPDLVMVDVNLPGINGYEICERVRSMDSSREIPVILLVGSFEPFDSDEAQRVGATAHLTKPFESIAMLVEMVQGYMGRDSAPKFEETMEYPTGSDIVVSESSIPFVGGFEDETIEAEQVSPTAEAEAGSGTADEAYTAVSYEPIQEETAPETAESFAGTPEDTDAEAAEHTPYEADDAEAALFSPVEDYEAEAAGETPEEYESEPEEESWETEGEVEGIIEERRYTRDTYHERSLLNSTDEFEPYDYNLSQPPRIPDQRPAFLDDEEPEYGTTGETHDPSATVQLDESDLLELPVDPGLPPLESEEPEIELTPVPEEQEPMASHRPHAAFESPGYETDREPEPEPVREPEEQRFEETIRETVHESAEIHRFEGEIPEQVIDEIARRVVAKLSDRAVREIAWEVVPEMAEMIIRKMTEQKLNE